MKAMWAGWQLDAILLGLWLVWMVAFFLKRPRQADGTPRRGWRALVVLGLFSAVVVILVGLGWHIQIARYGSS
jgi:hypothetical protein